MLIWPTCDPLEEKQNIFIGYFVFSSILCVIWEFLYCYFNIKTIKNVLVKKDYIFCLLSSCVSLLAFLSTTFFMNINSAFNCFSSYDNIVASVIFFASYTIIFTFSTLEKFCFENDMKILNSN